MKLKLAYKKFVCNDEFDVKLEFSDLARAKELYDRNTKREENIKKAHDNIIRILIAILCFVDVIFGLLCLPDLFNTYDITVLFHSIWGISFFVLLVLIAILFGVGMSLEMLINNGSVLNNIFNYKFAVNMIEKLNTATSFDVEKKDGYARITFNFDNDYLNIDIKDKYITYIYMSMSKPSEVVIRGHLDGNAYIITATLPLIY